MVLFTRPMRNALTFLLLLLFLTAPTFADTPDFSHKFGFSLAAGRNEPIFNNEFDQKADGENVMGAYLRYQINKESGLQFGYTRYEWSNSPTAARIYDLVYMYRLAKRHWFTPILGAGVGLVDIAHYNVDENLKLGLKARVGVEYVISENMLIDGVIDYQYVGKMPGEEREITVGEMHAIAPQLILTYFIATL